MLSRLLLCNACRLTRIGCETGSRSRKVAVKFLSRSLTSWLNGRVLHRSQYTRLLQDRNGGIKVVYKLQSTASSAVGKTEKDPSLLKKEITQKGATTTEPVEEELWKEQKLDIRLLPGYYARLSKIRLSGMVVLTAMAGYALAPGAMYLDTFLWASLGTGLCSAAANSFNQWLEVPFDSQMNRTKNRVLVRGLLSPLHVLTFGVVSGTLGIATLFYEVNALTALLGATNVLLYTCIYTPMKRLSIANTWVGSVVGALPPLMGWAACTGTLNPGAFVLAGILYSWQFPHFNALSWNLRPDYSRAGYRMMCVTDPALCRRVALRHCVSLIGLSTLLPICDVTTWWLALDTLPLNGYLTFLAWRFYQNSDSKSSRKLFRFSLIHLPVLMLLVMLHKKPKQEHTDAVPALLENPTPS